MLLSKYISFRLELFPPTEGGQPGEGSVPTHQLSGFRTNNFNETVLLSLLSDIYSAIDKSQLSLLVLFDVSAAFDVVDHQILLGRLETSCGIKGLLLLWLTFLTALIISGDSRTPWVPVSVLGPLLFILYTADILSLSPKHSASVHLFADDVQAYVHFPPSQLLLASKIDDLSYELHLWISYNRLSLNSSKTQLIWFGTTQQLQKLDFLLLSHRFPHFTFLSSIRP